MHSLICISNKDGITTSSVESDDIIEKRKVIDYVKSIVSAKFSQSISNNPDKIVESQYDWNPSKDYFLDINHPCRKQFNSTWNFIRKKCGAFVDENVEDQYRSLQIATQFHRCCFTCFKYCSRHEKLCRFGFPWLSRDCEFDPMIVKDRDSKSRIRISVLPQRNNAYLNGTLFDPLVTIAHGGNHDLQYIGNTVGAAEYVASYASKAEEPDKTMLSNIYNKKIAYLMGQNSCVTDRQRLYAVGCSLLGSSPIGSVQACYSLLGLKHVKSSRAVINVNPLHCKCCPLWITIFQSFYFL